jgi:hypothetical protein
VLCRSRQSRIDLEAEVPLQRPIRKLNVVAVNEIANMTDYLNDHSLFPLIHSWAYDDDIIADRELWRAPERYLQRHVVRRSNYDTDESLTPRESWSVSQ